MSAVTSAGLDENEAAAQGWPLYGAAAGFGKPAGLIVEQASDAARAAVEQRLLDAFLRHAGLDLARFRLIQASARHNGSSLDEELVSQRVLTEEELASAFSRTLGLPYEAIEPGITILRNARGEWQCGPRHLKGCGTGFEVLFHFNPMLGRLAELAEAIEALGPLRAALRIATRSDIARARAAFTAQERSDRARLSLAADHHRLSAREVMTPPQAAVLTLTVVLIFFAWAKLAWFWTGVHALCSVCAMGLTSFRLAVLSETPPLAETEARAAAQAQARVTDEGLPVYSVLVALHREAAMAPSIVAAMAALDWPRSKLEVFFVCEASDPETVHAVERAIGGEPNFFVIATPRTDPLTKPKALNFTLPLARGEFLVLYDAEDRPAPNQLRAAFSAFREGSPDLACLQAPLAVRNADDGWFEAMFAIEYDVLFRATLPWLAACDLPIPLGGTSNHFRRDVLMSVGGWDSHNVAEDADLGIRLARLGYRTGVIAAPTSETATGCWRDWRNQRTRWIKGWMQTWLVHMRDPIRLLRELGWRNVLAFQIVFGGMVASSLLHVVFGLSLLSAGLASLAGDDDPLIGLGVLAFLDVANLALAYASFIALARRVTPVGRRRHLTRLWSLWAYWFLVSVAGVRAALQLMRAPHRWEKTPHGPKAMRVSAQPGARVVQSPSTTSA